METELAKESCEVNPDTPNNPSPSFAHNCLRHSHASPPTSHPKEDISATVLYWFTAMLNKRENLTHKGDPSNHESIQENVSNSSPAFSARNSQTTHPPCPLLNLRSSQFPSTDMTHSSPYSQTPSFYPLQ
jgi:hypothetical protein